MIAHHPAPRFSAEFQILLNLLNFPYSLTQGREREREREAAVSRRANENVHKFKP
jgi:hypothetical protein